MILLGPAGAGKGTQAVRIAERNQIPHVSTGDLLRFAVAWNADIGLEAKRYMDAGELVPDGLVLELLRRRLSQEDALKGYMLDGFPRTTAQAEALDKMLSDIGQVLDAVVVLNVPEETLVRRLSSRASCPTCGRTYNLAREAPKRDMVCDRDSTPLFQRDDDKPEVVRNRLRIYNERTAPLVGYYEKQGIVRHVNGDEPLDQVTAAIEAAIKEIRSRGRG